MSDTNSRRDMSDAAFRVRARRDDMIAEAPRNDTARVQDKLKEAGEFLQFAAKNDGKWQDLKWIKEHARENITEARKINQQRATDFWMQRIQTGQAQKMSAQQQKQELRAEDRPRQHQA